MARSCKSAPFFYFLLLPAFFLLQLFSFPNSSPSPIFLPLPAPNYPFTNFPLFATLLSTHLSSFSTFLASPNLLLSHSSSPNSTPSSFLLRKISSPRNYPLIPLATIVSSPTFSPSVALLSSHPTSPPPISLVSFSLHTSGVLVKAHQVSCFRNSRRLALLISASASSLSSVSTRQHLISTPGISDFPLIALTLTVTSSTLSPRSDATPP